MASIFNSLHIGYSGLNAAQVGINTTGHNITNAETEGYTRQRVIQSAATPLFAANTAPSTGIWGAKSPPIPSIAIFRLMIVFNFFLHI